MNEYFIDIPDVGVDYQDEGQWRSYGVESYGNSFSELCENATVYETDQDGGSLNYYRMVEADPDVEIAAKLHIQIRFERLVNVKG